MFYKVLFVLTLVTIAAARHVPNYSELDEEDQLLFRAAYESPSYGHPSSYGHEDYQYQVEEVPNKLDLLKDGMWALKSKIKQMKAFNKALAANLLSTKLQVKEMLAQHLLALKTHHHVEIEKPAYDYQTPSKPAYSQYSPPTPQYKPPTPQYNPPSPQYNPPSPQYNPPAPSYNPPAPSYHSPAPQYGPLPTAAPQYGPPQYGHDPYYGH